MNPRARHRKSSTLAGLGQDHLTIDAQQISPIFNFTAATGDLTVEGLTRRNGRSIETNFNYTDRILFSGGASRFLSSGTLTVSHSTLSGNSVVGGNFRGSRASAARSLRQVAR